MRIFRKDFIFGLVSLGETQADDVIPVKRGGEEGAFRVESHVIRLLDSTAAHTTNKFADSPCMLCTAAIETTMHAPIYERFSAINK